MISLSGDFDLPKADFPSAHRNHASQHVVSAHLR